MYTVKPKEKHAKAYGRNLKISRKAAVKLCRVIRNKPLKRSKRLLENLVNKKQTLHGKTYTKTANEILKILNSCEKNASELDNEKLFVHASAHEGSVMRRRRRKAAYGSRMKNTNVEIILIEKGKVTENKEEKKKSEKKKEEKEKPDEKKEEKPVEKESEKKTEEKK